MRRKRVRQHIHFASSSCEWAISAEEKPGIEQSAQRCEEIRLNVYSICTRTHTYVDDDDDDDDNGDILTEMFQEVQEFYDYIHWFRFA